MSKAGFSARKESDEGYFTATSTKPVAGIRKVISSADISQSFYPKNARRLRKSNPFLQKGNDDEGMDLEKVEIERICEAEFRNKKTHSMPRIVPSTRQKVNERYPAATSAERIKGVTKKMSNFDSLCSEEVSVDSNGDPAMVKEAEEFEFKRIGRNCNKLRRKKIGKEWNEYLHGDINSNYHEWISLESRTQSNRKLNAGADGYDFLEVDETFSCSSADGNELGIANRTRSRKTIVKESLEIDNILLDVSATYPSSSDSIFGSMDDEDFEVENSSLSDSCEPLCCAEVFDIQEIQSMEMSALKSSNCSKQKTSAAKHSSKKEQEHLSYLHKEEEECCQLASLEVCSFRKKQLSIDAPSKTNEVGTSNMPRPVPEENHGSNTKLCDYTNEEEVHQHGSNNRKENSPKCPNYVQLYPQKDGNEAGANGSKDHSENENSGKIDYRDGNGCSHASSGFHAPDKYKTLLAGDETEHQTKRKQVSSKNHDFCKMLADSVLETEQMLDRILSDEESKQLPVPKVQNNISWKFRFEDEVPKPLEKTESEKEIEELFAELDFSWALVQMGSLSFPKVHNVDTNAPGEETQHARCARGNHELFLQDDLGFRCMYCPHVELGPRDVIPMWVEKTGGPERIRSSEIRQLPQFDKLHIASSVNDFTDFINNGNGSVWDVIPGTKESMYKHQQEGFEFLWKNLAGSINLAELRRPDPGGVGGCIISHAPGTGKTRLTIVFIETYLTLFPSCRPVIIAPASMLLTWEEEFRKWNVKFPFYNLNNLEFFGKENKTALRLLSGASRQNKDLIRMVMIYSWNKGRSILGISYSLYEKLAGEKYIESKTNKKSDKVTVDNKSDALRKILLEKPELVVLDEGHTPRNERSNIWNALLKLHTVRRIILSGTPFQNNFSELFNTLRLVRPAFAVVLAQEKIFAAEMITSRKISSRRKFDGKNARSTSISKVIDSAVEKLKLAMSPFVHVHKGTILQQSLPGLRDCVVLLKPQALQKSLIERMEGLQSTFEFEHKVALVSVHPYLVQFCASVENQWLGIDMGAVKASKINPNEGVKTKFIFELVRLSLTMNEKVLIFSQYIQPLELIKDQLKEIFNWADGKQIFQMQGKLDQRHRQLMINIFNDPESEVKVMLASMRCCSEGISLVGASRIVLLDVVWNPSVERQAVSRAYRIGQKKHVYTYHLMTSGTSEGEKYCRQAEKERLSELVFTSSSNEGDTNSHPAVAIEDRILEEMVCHEKLNGMFEKIINQPKNADLSQTFCLTL